MEDNCYHCGDKVIGKPIIWLEKQFCCQGCESVFRILQENGLGEYYVYEKNAGTRPKEGAEQRFAFLDVPELRERFIDYEDDTNCRVSLFLPTIHCSSCIYLLENLNRINPAIVDVKVQFSKREAIISFNQKELSFSELAYLLDAIGYSPNFGNRKESGKKMDKTYLYKLGVAGFAFGSIMLWSFPEYLGIEDVNPEFRSFTSYLSFAVSIPVLFYSANEYLISAWKAIKYKTINLDVPITLGIIALYAQSSFMIFSGSGPGYMDSFASFIFFLLIGKWFQSKTYKSLAFDRDYTSYFPVAVTRINTNDEEEIIAIESLEIGEQIRLKNEEIIPCDVVLESSNATFDYSFVTGEAALIEKIQGDFIYAGAKIIGKSVECSVQKEAKRSHLTELWNRANEHERETNVSDKFSIYFLIAICAIAICAGIGWLFIDPSKSLEVLVSVLIVACPCALALSRPFTYGNIMRLLGKKGLYLKNAEVIRDINATTNIVFDKTGTLTSSKSKVEFLGGSLTENEHMIVFEMVQNSVHPYARMIAQYLKPTQRKAFSISDFHEVKGKGMNACVNGMSVMLGSHNYLNVASEDIPFPGSWLSINGEIKGKFCLESEIRPGIPEMIKGLEIKTLHLLSGDGLSDQKLMKSIFPENATIRFFQTPGDKLDYVEKCELEGNKVLMIGDGLNDVGALKRATCGISISEDIFQFTPSSDAIIDARYLHRLPQLLKICRFSKRILVVCFSFSILYNVIGLTIAINGYLSPLVAAILMPTSSITVVLIATFGTLFFYPKK